MKTLRLLLITLISMWVVDAYGQDLPIAPRLSERTRKERWDILVKVALETIKEPENKAFYHKYDSIAIITDFMGDDGKNATRCNPLYQNERYYIVVFYDRSKKEGFEWGDFAFGVSILDRNAAAFLVEHGDGWGRETCGRALFTPRPRPKDTGSDNRGNQKAIDYIE